MYLAHSSEQRGRKPQKIHFKLNPNQGYGYISIRVSVRVRVRVADLGEILVELGFIIPPVRVRVRYRIIEKGIELLGLGLGILLYIIRNSDENRRWCCSG